MRRRLEIDTVTLSSKIPRSVVALEAERKHHWSLQHSGVGGAMRNMAAFTAIHTHGGMFEQERTPLVDVAFQAGLLIAKRMIDHAGTGRHAPGRGGRAVWIMAIGALHHTLIHPVFKGHVELRTNRSVAVVTKVRLRLCQQELGRCRFMYGVAVGTNDIGESVLRAAYLGASHIFGMAGQAIVENCFLRHDRESLDGGLSSARLDVPFAGAVAAFAAARLHRRLLRHQGFVVRIAVKGSPDVGMASFAGGTPYVAFCG